MSNESKPKKPAARAPGLPKTPSPDTTIGDVDKELLAGRILFAMKNACEVGQLVNAYPDSLLETFVSGGLRAIAKRAAEVILDDIANKHTLEGVTKQYGSLTAAKLAELLAAPRLDNPDPDAEPN